MKPVLHTKDLTLEACSVAQALDAVQRRTAVGRLTPHEDWPDADMPEVLRSYAQLVSKFPNAIGWGVWLFCLHDRIIGDGGFHGPPKNGRVEVGYSIVAPLRGRGFASQALLSLCRWAFDNGATAIAASCDAANAPSMRVLEKCGFARLEGESPRFELQATSFPPAAQAGK